MTFSASTQRLPRFGCVHHCRSQAFCPLLGWVGNDELEAADTARNGYIVYPNSNRRGCSVSPVRHSERNVGVTRKLTDCGVRSGSLEPISMGG